MAGAKISIIMPNYNGEKYLSQSISSVLNQTYADFELIIVDDGSTDSSREIIERYSDCRIKKIYLERGRHIAYACNQGFAEAKGEYIARIDCDDIWREDKLQKQISFMEDHPEIGACFTKVHIIDDDAALADEKYKVVYDICNDAENRSQEAWVHYFFEKGNCLCNSSSLVRKKYLDEQTYYLNLSYVTAEDFDLWSRLVLKCCFYVYEERLTYWRWTEDESKISGFKDGQKNAFENVHMLMRMNYLELMEKTEFIKYFRRDFICPEAETDLELECEKAFLLKRCTENEKELNFLGLIKFEQLLRLPGALDVLEKKYSFDLREFYKTLQIKNFYDKYEKEELLISRKNIKALDECLKTVNRNVDILNEELKTSRNYIADLEERVLEIDQLKEKLHNMEHISAKIAMERSVLQEQCLEYQQQITDIKNSLSWKLTKPIRAFLDTVIK